MDNLHKYMTANSFSFMSKINMWEITMVAYIKSNKIQLINGKVYTAQKACGVGNLIGNKGAIQMQFCIKDRSYNFFGCHLLHGQNNRVKRDEMMEDLVRTMKVERHELDPDIICDYNFIIGDLNYRFDTTYDDMIDNERIKDAPKLVDELD